MQYRGSIFDRFARSVRGVVPSNIVFTTRKLETALPSLKTPIPNELRSRVVYEIRCPRCHSSYAGQTSRHLMTRQEEHSKPDSPVGKHFRDCLGNTEDLRAEVLDSWHWSTTYFGGFVHCQAEAAAEHARRTQKQAADAEAVSNWSFFVPESFGWNLFCVFVFCFDVFCFCGLLYVKLYVFQCWWWLYSRKYSEINKFHYLVFHIAVSS